MLKAGSIRYVKLGKGRNKRTRMDLVARSLFGFGVCQVQRVDLIILLRCIFISMTLNIIISMTRKRYGRYLR